MKKNSAAFGNGGHFGNRENNAGLVVGPHDTDDGRLVGETFFVKVKIKGSVATDLQHGKLVFMAGEGIEALAKVFNSRMFHSGGDDMTLLRKGLQG